MKKTKAYSKFWPRDNLRPGSWRGIKAKKIKGKLLPKAMMWDGRKWINRDREYNLENDRSWFKPFKEKTTNRKEKRGQSKPR